MISTEIIFGSIAFVTSIIGLLPQLVKATKTRSTQDISMMMLINYLVCSIAWIIYGGYSNSMFVLLSNILGSFSSLVLIFVKFTFDKEQANVVNHA